MIWKLSVSEAPGEQAPAGAHGRFVLHRHRDAEGPHLDLRLEADGYLAGLRIEGEALADGQWAREKAPHPLYWLDQDGPALRVDEGTYTWLEQGPERRTLLLRGRVGEIVLEAAAEPGLPAETEGAICEALRAADVEFMRAHALIEDGLTARRRAVARFQGLSRELDGNAFDETGWARVMRGMSLEEIYGHLRALEARFDAKYPEAPVSRPERLPDGDEARAGDVMAIALEG